MAYKFIREWSGTDFCDSQVTIEVSGSADIDDLVSHFKNFLISAGFSGFSLSLRTMEIKGSEEKVKCESQSTD